MQLYTFFLALLTQLVLLVAYWLHKEGVFDHRSGSSHKNHNDEDDSKKKKEEAYISTESTSPTSADASIFQRTYFGVYLLVLAADWLQGPYIYSLYRYGHDLSEATVALLFTAGFVTAGVTAAFVGALADRCGRRNACLAYCGIYSLSCLSVLAEGNLPILFFGRALGGLSSTLLYSVFEAWMVAEHNARNLASIVPLDQMFSWSVMLSGFVAIVSGVIGETIVTTTGSRASPFMLAVVCLILAAVGIHRYWNENYGLGAPLAQQDVEEGKVSLLAQPEPTLDLQRLLTLALVTTTFEGGMFLFVFLWTPTLEFARTTARTTALGISPTLPLGLIFGSFMCAMMLGSMLVSAINHLYDTQASPRLLVDVLAIAGSALLVPVLVSGETFIFWSFAIFEMCVGMYYPTIGTIKSKVIPESVRAKVYAWMRLPLNLFVVVALGLTQEGDEHRRMMFYVTGGLLLGTACVVKKILP